MLSFARRLLSRLAADGGPGHEPVRSVAAGSRLLIERNAVLDSLREPDRRAEAETRVARPDHPWSEAQLEFILSPSPSIVVTAGAGSGKTATMVARVAVMHKVLGVPLKEIQVVSFTRDSAREFRERLAAMLLRMEGVVEPADAVLRQRAGELHRTVSTFHSAALRLAREAGLFSGADGLFDFHGMQRSPAGDEPAEQGDAPVLDVRLTEGQIVLLREAYTRAHMQDEGFRAAAAVLVDEEERRRLREAGGGSDPGKTFDEAWKWKAFIEREDQYQGSDLLPDGRTLPVPQGRRRDPWWSAVGDWLRARPDLEVALQPVFPVRPPGTAQLADLADGMEAAFEVRGVLIHVDRHALPDDRRQAPAGFEKLWWHQRERRMVVAYCSEEPGRHMFIGHGDFEQAAGDWQLSARGRRRLATRLRLGHEGEDVSGAAPEVLLEGGREGPAWRVLYEEGAFVESHGLAADRMPAGPGSPVEKAVLAMLGPFWTALEVVAEEHGLKRFGALLSGLADPDALDRIASRMPVHLLVDEFQDTSLELVVWLREWLAAAARAGRQPTIAAIGDPWQSIYAWRGSHPIFIERFAEIFPAAGRVHQVTLSENHRSRQGVIDVAEAMVDGAGTAGGWRHGVSRLPGGQGEPTEAVRLGEPLPSDHGRARTAGEHRPVSEALREFARDLLPALPPALLPDTDSPVKVFELRRSIAEVAQQSVERDLAGATSAALRAHPDAGREGMAVAARLYTFHRSKGLEADLVVIVGDSLPEDDHPLRDHVAQIASSAWRGLIPAMAHLPRYSETSRQEARRLMYVAITRARLGVLWVPLPGRDGKLPARGCYQLAAARLRGDAVQPAP